MNLPNSSRLTPRTLSLLLACALSLGIMLADRTGLLTRAAAAAPAKDKVGADLRKKIKERPGDERVGVIVQPAGVWGAALDADLKAKGATVKPAFKNFGARAVQMKFGDVEAAALRGDVAYVSLDREVKLLGHVSLTSGADA
ncbi:MAG: hypothetical protein M3416_11440, partial [Acidobacteriota bacterium]|nr:hypothetical protein [Acidobacteriota bacterium]